MKKVDFIIVGLGIAGVCFAEQLQAAKHSFIVFNKGSQGATKVSGGVLNPTVLKRFTAAWNTHYFSPFANSFYTSLCNQLQITSFCPMGIKRILNSVEEQNDWCVASDKKELTTYLSPIIEANTHSSIKAPFGLGVVHQGYHLNTTQLLDTYCNYLHSSSQLHTQSFHYNLLTIEDDQVLYENYQAKYIVFCEGAGVVLNPFFPLSISPLTTKVFVPNKGEYVIIKAPDLQIDFVLKGSMMLIPLGDDLYKVGATYGRDETDVATSTRAKQTIIEKLQKMISCPFEVVGQVAGVRPTVKDRKPLLGKHPIYKNMYFFNGLGTRGLTMAPLLAKQLYDCIKTTTPLPNEVNLARFL